MSAIIMWFLGFVFTYRVTGRDVLNTDGTIKDSLTGWVRVAASFFWPFFAFMVTVDMVKEWVEDRRNRP